MQNGQTRIIGADESNSHYKTNHQNCCLFANIECINKKFGEGIVVVTKGEFIVVNYATTGKKQLNLQVCLDKGLMEFI